MVLMVFDGFLCILKNLQKAPQLEATAWLQLNSQLRCQVSSGPNSSDPR